MTPDQALATFDRRGSPELAAALAELRPLAPNASAVVGWATVDLDVVAPPGGPDVVDELLGARARIVRPDLVALEPATEGALAAALARHGEGPVALYLVPGDEAAAKPAGRGSREGRTPFGPGRLVPGSPRGPFLIVVVPDRGRGDGARRAGTIARVIEQTNVLLRPAAPADAERIAALFTDEGYPAGPSDIVVRLERFTGEAARIVVADLDGEVLGFIALHAVPRFEHDDAFVRIVALVVDPGVRERGIGRQLMDEAERFGRELGAAFVEITAGHHRPDARRLYESLGYDAGVTAYLRKRI